MRRLLLTAPLAAALFAAGAVVVAQPQHGPGHGMPMMQGGGPAAAQAPANASPATRAFMAADEKMHRDMTITYSGNADRDFVSGMIPHHQGAIDMARIVLEHGRDPDVRALAESIIRDQEREIAQMRVILARIPAQ
ncbi:DUF305 domain-containing protein [Elioraea sp.]|uniref:CopM family metallochaperone n=1 Tax=Elioraea sp. TaxID=2185103 RepID=UPI0025C6340B|nr:DUF305 domain-containing protein [Elioraea sp.]